MYTQKNNIIIIEGIWKSGKTTFIERQRTMLDFILIKEPNHLLRGKTGNKLDITYWYLKEHYRNLQDGFALAKKNNITVVVERSPLSSLIFMKIYLKFSDSKIQAELINLEIFLNKINSKLENKISILFLRNKNIDFTLKYLKSNPYLQKFADKKKLISLENYLQRYICNFIRKDIMKPIRSFRTI